MMRQPTIRPGQRKPYAKATRQQIEERTQATAMLLFFGFSISIAANDRRAFGPGPLHW